MNCEVNYMSKQACLFLNRVLQNNNNSAVTVVNENVYKLLFGSGRGVVRKERIIEMVWSSRGIVVADSSYYQLIYQLRKSLKSIGMDDLVLTRSKEGIELLFDVKNMQKRFD